MENKQDFIFISKINYIKISDIFLKSLLLLKINVEKKFNTKTLLFSKKILALILIDKYTKDQN